MEEGEEDRTGMGRHSPCHWTGTSLPHPPPQPAPHTHLPPLFFLHYLRHLSHLMARPNSLYLAVIGGAVHGGTYMALFAKTPAFTTALCLATAICHTYTHCACLPLPLLLPSPPRARALLHAFPSLGTTPAGGLHGVQAPTLKQAVRWTGGVHSLVGGEEERSVPYACSMTLHWRAWGC